MRSSNPHIIVIGAGFTGCATAHDLALRGFRVTVLERGDIANGTSGRTHGLLHSGARYCVTDQDAAIECIEENILLRKIAHHCIEYNGGLFVALDEEDEAYGTRFEQGAQKCGIPIERLTGNQARKKEPNLTPKTRLAYSVPDGVFDPLRLAMAFAATAKKNGVEFLTYHEVTGFDFDGKGNIREVSAINRHTNEKIKFTADMVINATGAWAGLVARLAGVTVDVIPTPGVMVCYDQRLVQRVINRLCEPDDGDILIPQRRMVVIGTTSFEVEDVDYIPVTPAQVELMHQKAAELVPAVAATHQRGAYMSARPLIGSATLGRSLSRTFKCYHHQETDGIGGLVTITGGKATTCRVMAEKTVDLVCNLMGVSRSCETREVVLDSYRDYYTHS
ncbi:MAG TPA: FAD-dependent oxidoreductase [Anaerolineaceae bacterium]|nr:FAD-dependent oxidoreductase [Anaerolineaceae bacterium]